jgi:hypothetical protein
MRRWGFSIRRPMHICIASVQRDKRLAQLERVMAYKPSVPGMLLQNSVSNTGDLSRLHRVLGRLAAGAPFWVPKP